MQAATCYNFVIATATHDKQRPRQTLPARANGTVPHPRAASTTLEHSMAPVVSPQQGQGHPALHVTCSQTPSVCGGKLLVNRKQIPPLARERRHPESVLARASPNAARVSAILNPA